MEMKVIENKEYEGERPLYGIRDTILRNVTIHMGESSIKHGYNLMADHCTFEGKYPFWLCTDVLITDSHFAAPGGRAAIWYAHNVTMRDTLVDAPKMFRDMTNIVCERVNFTDAKETFWNCGNVSLNDVTVKGADYLFMHSHDICIENYRHDGNYSFQWCRNVEIHNAVINSKDAFWNTENVTVYDSEINGEFLGWHSKNLRFVNCRISGSQGLCYAEDLVLENCTLDADCDLAFEYSSVTAQINGPVTSIKNPTSGHIRCSKVGEVIINDFVRAPNSCVIETDEDEQ